MLRLRLQRFGKKKRPFYRIVAADGRAPRDGRFKEWLGIYDPLNDPVIVDLKKDRVDYWLSVGAQPSETVASLIKLHESGKTLSLKAVEQANRERKLEARKAAMIRAAVKPVEVKAEPAEAAAAEEAPAAAEEAAASEEAAPEADA